MNGRVNADPVGFIEHGGVRNSPEERDAAALTIAANATGPADALQLMQMLGLAQDIPAGKRIGRRW